MSNEYLLCNGATTFDPVTNDPATSDPVDTWSSCDLIDAGNIWFSNKKINLIHGFIFKIISLKTWNARFFDEKFIRKITYS